MKLTARIARLATETRPADIPEDAVRHAKLSFLDTLGAAIAGMTQPASRILAEHVREAATKGDATVLGQRFRCDPANAAFVNGTAADVVGQSDCSAVQMPRASASIWPAVWAVAESRRSDGVAVVAAQVIGEQVARILAAGVLPGLRRRGWHSSAVLNTFGATVAAGRVLGLDTLTMQNALGIAGGEASGMGVASGTMSKAFGAGRSARDGIRAAYLAQLGFTGPVDVIEARDGFLQTFGDGDSGDAMVEALASPYQFIGGGTASDPQGPSDRPSVWEAVAEKFRISAAPWLGKSRTDRVVELVSNLEQRSNLAELFDALNDGAVPTIGLG